MANFKTSIKTILLFVIASLNLNAKAWVINQGDLDQWLQSLSPKSSVYAELEKFYTDQGIDIHNPEVQNHIQTFVQKNHQLFLSKVDQILKNSNQPNLKCHSDSVIDFLDRFTNLKIGDEFESEALRIETMDCLGKINHHKVFTILMSDEFQIKSITGLQDVTSDQSTNLICQKTSIFPLGKSNYCFTQNIWQDATTYVIQSFNESNHSSASSPVYFREVFTVIKKMTNGEVFIYNLAIGRGPDLPFHSIVKATARNQQQSMIQSLIEYSK